MGREEVEDGMKVIRKDASITNTDDDFPGQFQVVLSAPTKDRDGDTLLPEEWKQPLPDHVTFDVDHLMSVAGTVGSGKPHIDDEGRLIVTGSYSSLPRAQEVRTLVKEGHINRTSVAFMTEKTQKDGKSTVVRELLNGAFVAVPSNREAVVLASKSAGRKAGARNARADQEHIDAIAAHAVALGANLPADRTGGDDSSDEDVAAGKSVARATVKTVAGSYEQAQQAISDALSAAYPSPDDDSKYVYAYPTATFPSTVVYRVSGNTDLVGQWQAAYTVNADGTVTLGTPARVNLVEQIVPVGPDADTASTVAADGAASKGASETDEQLQHHLMAARRRYYSAALTGRNN